jgi:glucose/arabinose dehydrogenase
MARRYVALLLICVALALVANPKAAGADLPLERLNLPPGFKIEVLAEVPGARSLAVSADGRTVYVGTRGSKVFALLKPNTARAPWQVTVVKSGLKVPNGLAVRDGFDWHPVTRHMFLTDNGDDRLGDLIPPQWRIGDFAC